MPTPELDVPETNDPQVVNLSQANVDSVHAELVRMHQAYAGTVAADDVELSTSAAGGVNAQSVNVHDSLVGGVNAEEAHVWDSVIGGVNGSLVNAQGTIAMVAGQSVTVEGARVGVTAANEVRGGRVDTVVLLAGRVEGEVHTTMDTRGAIIAGLVAGLFTGLIVLVGRIAFRRDS
jgi:hypothetical protein